MSRTHAILAFTVLLCASCVAQASDFDASFDWVAVGNFGPLYDSKTQDGFTLSPGDYTVTASLERTFKILTFRTQVGEFLYQDEIPSIHRENDFYALLTAMDRFGEDRWALVVLGGVGYYNVTQQVDFHVGLGFDYRVHGPWMVRGEAVYHHEVESVAVTIGGGYMF
ncbi:MAG: hypothetical protein U0166_17460 [Acidobacteriota bacterium]